MNQLQKLRCLSCKTKKKIENSSFILIPKIVFWTLFDDCWNYLYFNFAAVFRVEKGSFA